MKFSTTTIAATLLLSNEAYAAAQVRRNRKVKIYSSDSSVGKDDTVDPYLALPDERAQRSLQELSVSMSLSSSTGSVPTTIGSMPLTLLEMSMPATSGSFSVGSVPVEIGSVPVEIGSMPSSTEESVPFLPVQGGTMEVMAGESVENSAMTTHSSVAAAAAIVSAIAGVVALV